VLYLLFQYSLSILSAGTDGYVYAQASLHSFCTLNLFYPAQYPSSYIFTCFSSAVRQQYQELISADADVPVSSEEKDKNEYEDEMYRQNVEPAGYIGNA